MLVLAAAGPFGPVGGCGGAPPVQIGELAGAGMSPAQIGDRLGIGGDRVRQVAGEHGIAFTASRMDNLCVTRHADNGIIRGK